MNDGYPSNIICLTEESVETLYLLGQERRIKGVSAFVKRPLEAQKLPKVSFFTSSNIKKIKAHRPDLVLGFSDIQKDIAKELIGEGMNVFIANHRSLAEILDYVLVLGGMVGAQEEARELRAQLVAKMGIAQEFARSLKKRPRVYFEEWDDPMISAIKWVSELIELCGGIDVNKDLSDGILAKDRFVDPLTVAKSDPDLIIGCWCGKKVKVEEISSREAFKSVKAVKENRVIEVEPEVFLQPGPAPFLDGIDILMKLFKEWDEKENR